MAKIGHSGYLHKALRSLESVQNDLFIFGHSFDSSDEHILRLIESNTGIRRLFVGLYGEKESPENLRIKQRAIAMNDRRSSKRQLGVHFYQAESAHVWG